MYYVIARKILKNLICKGYIKEKGIKIWRIFIEYILALGINVLVASGIGHTLNLENKMIVFSIFYTILRIGNGGNYLKLNMKNTVTYWGMGVAVLFCIDNVLKESYGKNVMLTLLLMSFVLVIVSIPIKIKNMVWPEDLIRKIRLRSIITISAECICLVIGTLLFDNCLIAAAIIGVFVQSISLVMIPDHYRNIIDVEQSAVIFGEGLYE